jgi:DNA polymerase III subunit delta
VKLKASAVDGFIARPDPRVATVLLYGPDAGLVAERGRRLAARIVDDLQDPFRVSELGGDDLRERPGRLVEEAQALCLLGGRRLVRVRDAGDLATVAVRDLLALPAQEGFVVLEAGDLPGSSSLRKLVEGAATAAALPCYRDEARDLGGLVRGLLAEHRLAAEPDALSYLETHVGGDRAVTRAELAKLALYLADRPGARVTLADAAAVVGDSSALGVEDAVNAAMLGRRPELERALDRLLAEGEAPVRLIRSAADTVMRLMRLSVAVAAGSSIETAVAGARPPIFYKHKDVFVAALRRWSPDRLEAGSALLQAAELRCKSGGGTPDAALCRAVLAQLAAMAQGAQLPADGRGNRR